MTGRLTELFKAPIGAPGAEPGHKSIGYASIDRRRGPFDAQSDRLLAIASRRAGNIFKVLDRAFGLRIMMRTARKLAIVHRPKQAAHHLFGDGYAKLLVGPLT